MLWLLNVPVYTTKSVYGFMLLLLFIGALMILSGLFTAIVLCFYPTDDTFLTMDCSLQAASMLFLFMVFASC